MAPMAKGTSLKVVPAGRRKCIWMEAGVVSFKLCDNNYDCPTCAYDHAMQAKVEEARLTKPQPFVEAPKERFTESWVQKMMKLPASRRKCRYMLTGEVSSKICPNAYECGSCEFDQMMQERLTKEVIPVRAESHVAGLIVAEDIYYHEGHTWARPEYGGRVRVGLDDFARRIVGKIKEVQLPPIGREVKQGEVAFTVRRNGHTVGILSPVDGIVVYQNPQILREPMEAHRSPYERGWFVVVEPTALRKNLRSLYFGEEAHKFMMAEKDRLISQASSMSLAADGAVATEDLFEELEETKWLEIVRTFLRS
jgi:glycine cleavage system H lipoate-binding protein